MNWIHKLAGYFLMFTGLSTPVPAQVKSIDLISPNGELKLSVILGDRIYYSIAGGNRELLTKNHLALTLSDGILGENPKLILAKKAKGDETIKPYIALKFSTVKSTYNDLVMTFKENYAVEFRAFDDGIAYRFITSKKGDVEVMNEYYSINFPNDYLLHLELNNGFKTAYEELYQHVESASWKPTDKMANLPVLIDTKTAYKILSSESGLSHYPGMFLTGTGSSGAEGALSLLIDVLNPEAIIMGSIYGRAKSLLDAQALNLTQYHLLDNYNKQ